MSKYGVSSGPYFPAIGLNTEDTKYLSVFVSLRIQSECGKIRTRGNSVFGHISHSVIVMWFILETTPAKSQAMLVWVLAIYYTNFSYKVWTTVNWIIVSKDFERVGHNTLDSYLDSKFTQHFRFLKSPSFLLLLFVCSSRLPHICLHVQLAFSAPRNTMILGKHYSVKRCRGVKQNRLSHNIYDISR